MIDLHSHIVPGVDDGAASLADAIEMAKLAVTDGIRVVACTPHMMAGVYANTGPAVRTAVKSLQSHLDAAAIPLRLVTGADVHMAPDLLGRLKDGQVLSLCDSRYFLLEPPHHVAPPRLEEFVLSILNAGYVPILTHPERLTWVRTHYDIIVRLVRNGVWVQVTGGSLTGRFGKRAMYWAERLLDERLVHILASDAHDVVRRPPNLSEAFEAAAERIGEEEAIEMVRTRPQAVLDDLDPAHAPALARTESTASARTSLWQRAFGN